MLDYLNLQEYLTRVEDVLPSTTQAEVLVALRSLSQRVEYLPSDTVEQRYVFITNGTYVVITGLLVSKIQQLLPFVFSPQLWAQCTTPPSGCVCVGDSVWGWCRVCTYCSRSLLVHLLSLTQNGCQGIVCTTYCVAQCDTVHVYCNCYAHYCSVTQQWCGQVAHLVSQCLPARLWYSVLVFVLVQ